MTTVNIVVSKMNVNMALFRDWEHLPREVFEMLGNRTEIGNMIVFKFHDDILKRGYHIVDENDEIQHEAEMKPNRVRDVNEKYAKARKAFKQFGISVLSWYRFEDNKEKQLYWLEDTHIYKLDVESGTKRIKELSFVPPFYDKVISQNAIDLPTKELDNFRLLANYDTKINTYRSTIESIADRIVGWAVLFQQLTLLEIREGNGIRYALLPASYLADPTVRKKWEDILENVGNNIIAALPNDSELDKNVQFGIKYADGASNVPWSEALDMLLVPIALHTGLTKEYLKGNEMGMRSSEKNRQKSNESETQEQESMASDLLWIWGKILSCELCLDGTHKLDWSIKEELDETEKLANYKVAFDILNSVNWDKLGMKIEDVLDKFGIDIPVDHSLIEKYKTQQEALSASLSQGSMNDNRNLGSNQSNEQPGAGKNPGEIATGN